MKADSVTLEQMTKVKRCVVDVVLPGGTAVLNADDPLVAGMAEYCKGNVVFFSRDTGSELILKHRESGGRAVILRETAIWLAEGGEERCLCPLASVAPSSSVVAFQGARVIDYRTLKHHSWTLSVTRSRA